ARVGRDARPIQPLVEIGAGLLPARDLDNLAERAELDLDCLRHAAAQHAAPRRKPLLAAYARLGALEDAVDAGAARDERVRDRLAPMLAADRKKLADGHVGVTVDHDARQAVGLREHEPARTARLEHAEAAAQLDGGAHARRDEIRVDRRAVEGPDARADLGPRRI